MTARVLVLDANQRSALAVVRSLGRKGIHVLAGESAGRSLAGCSRYASQSVAYPAPASSPAAFLEGIRSLVADHGVDVVLPMTDITTTLLLQRRGVVGSAVLPFPSFEVYDSLANKQRLLTLARSLSLPVPATHVIRNAEERACVYEQVRFPVVVKPVYSKVLVNGQWLAVGVRYAASLDELERVVINSPCLGVVPLLVQQQVVGEGHGVFALYDSGRPIAFFSHRRLRERPPTGGVSVFSESVSPNPESKRIAQTLLSHVGWHGVAMVEFKRAREGVPFLMEVNGRFWGSLQLAIDAGVDFPHLLYRVATGDRLEEHTGYREGCRSRWLLGDLDHLYWILKQGGGRYSLGQKLRALREFLRFFDSSRHEVNRLDDIGPFFHELGDYFFAKRS